MREEPFKSIRDYLIDKEDDFFPVLKKLPEKKRPDYMERVRCARLLAQEVLRFMVVQEETEVNEATELVLNTFREQVEGDRRRFLESLEKSDTKIISQIFTDTYKELIYYYKLQSDHNCQVCKHRSTNWEIVTDETGKKDRVETMYCEANRTCELRVTIPCDAFDVRKEYRERWKGHHTRYRKQHDLVKEWLRKRVGFLDGKPLPKKRPRLIVP